MCWCTSTVLPLQGHPHRTLSVKPGCRGSKAQARRCSAPALGARGYRARRAGRPNGERARRALGTPGAARGARLVQRVGEGLRQALGARHGQRRLVRGQAVPAAACLPPRETWAWRAPRCTWAEWLGCDREASWHRGQDVGPGAAGGAHPSARPRPAHGHRAQARLGANKHTSPCSARAAALGYQSYPTLPQPYHDEAGARRVPACVHERVHLHRREVGLGVVRREGAKDALAHAHVHPLHLRATGPR